MPDPDDRRPTGTDDDAPWRDERELPVSALNQAMASYSFDGQVDDATGGDASAEDEAAFEREAESATQDPHTGAPGDPDPDSELGRRVRPSPDGRTGPV